MNESKISVRYAKSLFLFAKEKGIVEDIKKDLEIITNSFISTPKITLVLESPVHKTSEKIKLIKELYSHLVSPHCLKFLVLAIQNKREFHLKGIIRNFEEFYRRDHGIKKATLTTAVPIDRETREAIINMINNFSKSKIELSEFVNKNLIGGFVLRIEDQQIDSSVLFKLKRIQQELIETSLR
jgi:F-type H+-transporting ATPase subunit delta